MPPFITKKALQVQTGHHMVKIQEVIHRIAQMDRTKKKNGDQSIK